MPWLEKTHRCALPDIPEHIGPGSKWACGDVGDDICGRIYIVTEQGLWAATDESVDPTDGPLKGSRTVPNGIFQPQGHLVLG